MKDFHRKVFSKPRKILEKYLYIMPFLAVGDTVVKDTLGKRLKFHIDLQQSLKTS